MKKIFFLAISLFCVLFTVTAQTTYNEADFKSKPEWIIMMDDSTVNYNQAVKAFDIYWKDRIKPGDDAEKMNEKANETPREEREQKRYEKKLRKMSAAERNEYDRINYQYKRFMNWMREMKPFVQQDGSILTPQQRMNIWKKQQDKVKGQNSKGN